MRRFPAFRAVGIILLTTVLAAVAAGFLPDRPYQRFEQLDGTEQSAARWIYERVHDDPTPIDIAFFGSSRVAASVDAPMLQAGLANLGVSAHVVNFATPEEGRNLNFVYASELFSAKRPKLIVLGVIEKPGRFGHPAYKYVAPASMLVDPAYVGNLTYLRDLMYLPFRQMRLFAARLLPGLSGLRDQFDPAQYAGSNPSFTSILHLPNGKVLDRTRVVPEAVLEDAHNLRAVADHPPILPQSLADVEFGGDRQYVRSIVHLAEAHGARVAFLFLPYYKGPDVPQEQALYASLGPVWNASFLATHPEWYSDLVHANRNGTTALTEWITPKIKALLDAPASSTVSEAAQSKS